MNRPDCHTSVFCKKTISQNTNSCSTCRASEVIDWYSAMHRGTGWIYLVRKDSYFSLNSFWQEKGKVMIHAVASRRGDG